MKNYNSIENFKTELNDFKNKDEKNEFNGRHDDVKTTFEHEP